MPETTREAVRRLVRDEPTWNQARIASALGVSRERVRQIVTQEGLAVAKGVIGIPIRSRRSPAPAPRVITGGVPMRITHTMVGTIAELLVAADLTARGYLVFFPLVRHGACDLISMGRLHPWTLERIEVRCGHRNAAGRVIWSQTDSSKSDRRAIVITGEPVRYSPPFDGE